MLDRIIRPKECVKMVGTCNVHLRRLEAEGNLRRLEAEGKFPPRFKLFEDSGPYGAVGWRLSDIQVWIEKRAATAHVPTIILLVMTYGFIFGRAVA